MAYNRLHKPAILVVFIYFMTRLIVYLRNTEEHGTGTIGQALIFVIWVLIWSLLKQFKPCHDYTPYTVFLLPVGYSIYYLLQRNEQLPSSLIIQNQRHAWETSSCIFIATLIMNYNNFLVTVFILVPCLYVPAHIQVVEDTASLYSPITGEKLSDSEQD